MRRSRLVLLSLSHLVDDLYSGAVPAMLPFFVAERHYSYAAVSGLALAGTVLSSVAQPVFGMITDRYRLTWLVWAGMLLAGLGIGLSALTDDYALTWIMIALSGLGVAAYHPEAARSARAAAGTSAQGMSWFAVGGNLGIALAPLFVAGVLGIAGLRGAPLLAAPAVVMTFAIIAALARTRQQPAAGGPGDEPATKRPPDNDWRSFGWLLAVVMTRSIGYTGAASFLALFAMDRFGTTAAVGSAVLSVLTGTGVLGTVLGGWMADRLGRVTTLRLAYAVAPVAFSAMLLAPDLAVLFAATAVFGLASFVPFSVQVTLSQEYLPGRIGTASGVTLGLGISVGGLFTPVIGMLADRYGLTTALATLLVFLVACIPLTIGLRETRKPDHVSPTGTM
jgi:MFS transporter, FSR family, fosmidomycin resistance protein